MMLPRRDRLDAGPTPPRGLHIWVVGSTMVDMITYVSRSPAAGETLVGMRVACALASDSVRRPGTQRSFPTSEAALRLIADSGDVRIPDHLPH